MSKQELSSTYSGWKKHGIIIFRIIFIYFLIQAVPADWKYYRNLFYINWADLNYRDLFYLARYTPQIITGSGNTLTWGINTLNDWGIIFILAVLGAFIWELFEKDKQHVNAERDQKYNKLYYLLRVILRYRLAVALLAYGFIKIFPMQQPYPSLSLLNTNYGDFTDWKVASFSYGVAPSYEALLGWTELISAALLFHRKTASIGAAIAIGYMGNVFLSNLGYGGGEVVYTLYLITLGLVILFYDVNRFYTLLSLGKPTAPNTYKFDFITQYKNARFIKAGVIVALVISFGCLSWNAYSHNGYQYPSTGGLANTRGFYNVREFKANRTNIPYSLTDPKRWQNVVFEQWNTISIRSNTIEQPDLRNTEEIYTNDSNRDYESSGSSGRHFYSYTIDRGNHRLILKNKNPKESKDVFALQYEGTGTDHIILWGQDAAKDSIYVLLDKIHKSYILDESVKLPKNRSVFE
jgi:hypothetical protein